MQFIDLKAHYNANYTLWLPYLNKGTQYLKLLLLPVHIYLSIIYFGGIFHGIHVIGTLFINFNVYVSKEKKCGSNVLQ